MGRERSILCDEDGMHSLLDARKKEEEITQGKTQVKTILFRGALEFNEVHFKEELSFQPIPVQWYDDSVAEPRRSAILKTNYYYMVK